MSITIEQLTKWKEQIEEAKTQKTVLETQLKASMEELLKTFGCKTIAEAEALLDKKQKELHDAQDKFDKSVESIQDDYDLD